MRKQEIRAFVSHYLYCHALMSIPAFRNTAEQNSKTSYTYHLSYLRLLPSASPEALTASVKLITAALSDPTMYDFDPLFRIDAVVESAKDHEIFELLRVFLTGGLEELQAWGEKYGNDGRWEKYGTSFFHSSVCTDV